MRAIYRLVLVGCNSSSLVGWSLSAIIATGVVGRESAQSTRSVGVAQLDSLQTADSLKVVEDLGIIKGGFEAEYGQVQRFVHITTKKDFIGAHKITPKAQVRWPYKECGSTLNAGKRDSLLAECDSARKYYYEWPVEDEGFEPTNKEDCLRLVGSPLLFESPADFDSLEFDSTSQYKPALFRFTNFKNRATFCASQFPNGADFNYAQFASNSDFSNAFFYDTGAASFYGSHFKGKTSFSLAGFDGITNFSYAEFGSTGVSFRGANFQGECVSFEGAQFSGDVTFNGALFESQAECLFTAAQFMRKANFQMAQFVTGVRFDHVEFGSSSQADFALARFGGHVRFERTKFGCGVGFAEALFDSSCFPVFLNTSFSGHVDFEKVRFAHGAVFHRAKFDSSSSISFVASVFLGGTTFRGTSFNGPVDFSSVFFETQQTVDFDSCEFADIVNFTSSVLGDSTLPTEAVAITLRGAILSRDMRFNGTRIFGAMDFRGTTFARPVMNKVAGSFDSGKVDLELQYLSEGDGPWAVFDNSRIYDTIHVGNSGSWLPQNFDFSLAQFPDGRQLYEKTKLPQLPAISSDKTQPALDSLVPTEFIKIQPAIILYGPIGLKMQEEKFDYLHLFDSLSYFEKKNIIDYLKQNSYEGSNYKRERFELDYKLAKAVAFQKPVTAYTKYPLYHPLVWIKGLHYATLGYGYRPFWLLYWVLCISLVFACLYYVSRGGAFAGQIGLYIGRLESADDESKWKQWHSKPESFYYCLWFSITVLLAIRLKPKLLVSFGNWEKRFILTEYLIGLFLYGYFLLGSKAGSLSTKFVELFSG